jgi:maltose O-acetyltransferase
MPKNKKEKMVVQTEKKKWLPEFYSAGDAVLVKDRRRAKNLLHRLNNGIPSDKKQKHGKSKRVDPNAGRIFYVEPPFHCDYGYYVWRECVFQCKLWF